MHQLFVYGTLRKGGVSHHLLKGARVVKEGVWLEGYALFSAGWYPLAVEDAAGRILGDVVSLPVTLWPALDAYEGDDYERIFLEVQQCWLYLYKKDPGTLPAVAGGDWLAEK